jgi:hypothetical protein
VDLEMVIKFPCVANVLLAERALVVPDCALKDCHANLVREGDRKYTHLRSPNGEGIAAFFTRHAPLDLVLEARLLKDGVVIATLSGSDIEAVALDGSKDVNQALHPESGTKMLALQGTGGTDGGHEARVRLPFFAHPFPHSLWAGTSVLQLEVQLNDWRTVVRNLHDETSPVLRTVGLPMNDPRLALVILAQSTENEASPLCGADFMADLRITRSSFVRRADVRAFRAQFAGKEGSPAAFVLDSMDPQSQTVTAEKGARTNLKTAGATIKTLWWHFVGTDNDVTLQEPSLIEDCAVAIDEEPFVVKKGSECASHKPFLYTLDFGPTRFQGLSVHKVPDEYPCDLVTTFDIESKHALIVGGLVWRPVVLGKAAVV